MHKWRWKNQRKEERKRENKRKREKRIETIEELCVLSDDWSDTCATLDDSFIAKISLSRFSKSLSGPIGN